MSRKRPDSPSKVKVASCLTDSNIAVTSNSFMHVYVRLANFNSQASFPKCKPVTISSVYSQRSKVEKIPTQKQRELVKVLQGNFLQTRLGGEFCVNDAIMHKAYCRLKNMELMKSWNNLHKKVC